MNDTRNKISANGWIMMMDVMIKKYRLFQKAKLSDSRVRWPQRWHTNPTPGVTEDAEVLYEKIRKVHFF